VILPDTLAARRSFGRQVLGRLSRLVRDRFRSGQAADIESETLFRNELSRAFPADRVAGEELGIDEQAYRKGWIIDPLDGSTNHSNGIPLFAVSLAYNDAGETRLGWVSDPMRGEWFEARAAAGLLRGGSGSNHPPGSDASVVALSHRWRSHHSGWRRHFPDPIKVRAVGSIALEMAWIATGRLAAGAWYRTNPWDVTAGELLIRESGGLVVEVPDGGPGERWALSRSALFLRQAFLASSDGKAATGSNSP